MASRKMGTEVIRTAMAVGVLGVLVAGDAAGQTRASVSGRVLDAQTGRSLAGVVVNLLRPADSSTPSGAIADGRMITMQTDQNGAYRFDELPIDRYRLLARRLGYRPAAVEIDLRGTTPLRVSLEMTVNPVLLEPERVTGQPIQTFRRSTGNAPTASRQMLETLRADRYVAGDVRILTEDDVLEGVTLAEADLLRATHHFPGVSTRDDYTAELWTRGAPWSHTRVYYDGLPLYNPLHAAGALSGIHPDAVGAVEFYPGVRQPHQGEGAAGTLTVTSRRATTPHIAGNAELSVASARASAASRVMDGNVGWMVAARRSYVDLVSDVVDHFRADATVHVPYAFFDLAARMDARIGTDHWLDVSALWERDDVRGSIPNVLSSNQGFWGNRMVQASFSSQLDAMTVRYMAGISRYDGHIGYQNLAAGADGDVPAHAPTDNRITYWTTGADVQPGWWDVDASLGYRIVHQDQAYAGPRPSAYPTDIQADTLRFADEQTHLAVWLSGRRWFGEWIEVDAGVRMELGERVRNAPVLAVGPRMVGRAAWPDERTTFSVGWGRSFQYTQTVAPTGPGIGPELHLTDVWLLAGDTIPAVRSDLATAGVERRFADAGWIAAINVYRRFATGVAVPDPRPGELLFSGRPVYVEGINVATGAEVSLRRVAGAWTGSLAYSLGASDIRAGGAEFPAPSDRRHVIDATVQFQSAGPLRMAVAATAASAAPFTRVVSTTRGCDSLPGICYGGPLVAEEANHARGPVYTGVNAMAEWRHDFQGWRLGITLQLRNVLNRANAVTYTGSIAQCTEPSSATIRPVRPGVCDEFARGLPLLPLLAIRAEF